MRVTDLARCSFIWLLDFQIFESLNIEEGEKSGELPAAGVPVRPKEPQVASASLNRAESLIGLYHLPTVAGGAVCFVSLFFHWSCLQTPVFL